MGREKGLLYVVKHATNVLKKSSSEISHQPDDILKTNIRFLNYLNQNLRGVPPPPPLEFEMCGNLKMTDYQIFLTILFRDKIKHQGSKF